MESLTESLVREVLSDELPAGEFQTVESDLGVVLESSAVRCQVSLDPRGEFEISVTPIGAEAWQGWSYQGFVGSTSLRRLLELAREQLRAEPRILGGDVPYFTALARDRQRELEDYNARLRGQPVRLRPGRLP